MSETEKKEYGILNVIRSVLWGEGTIEVDREIFEEMKSHTVSMLLSSSISFYSMPADLCREWKMRVVQQLAFYEKYRYAQSKLPLTVPYVILKGTEAAKYYPQPEYRTMGDIDVMTAREDMKKAYQELVADGYVVLKEDDREITLKKNGIELDLHYYFASLNDCDQARYMDDLIINSITDEHSLPDPVNGLVLLEHISQHLEHGLGLRQVIDWMMFVNKCLPDEKWAEFRVIAEKTGMETLAVVITRMCEIYLGLPHREWCAEADEKLCRELLNYVLASGNFGSKRKNEDVGEEVFFGARNLKTAFGLLQERGLANWTAARKHKILKPFAWLYQAGRYAVRGLKRDNASRKMRSEREAAKRRIKLFDSLKVKQTPKGLAIYKDGEYRKK